MTEPTTPKTTTHAGLEQPQMNNSTQQRAEMTAKDNIWFAQELRAAMSDARDGLKGSNSSEEALRQLIDAVEQITDEIAMSGDSLLKTLHAA